jgi:hypothetical protein
MPHCCSGLLDEKSAIANRRMRLIKEIIDIQKVYMYVGGRT